jgi:2-polyprenyl-6-methoxyphenol hydroxylase-like FAD-dependent oxidoreductase
MVERVLIVGGGMAGLAAAIALRQHGLTPEIVEQADAWSSSGAGLYLVGNGTRALQALGLAGALAYNGAVIRTQSFLNHRGAWLAQVDAGAFWAECGPCLGIRRTVLHHLLAEQVTGLRTRFGATVQALQQHEDHVAIRFSDGSSNTYDFVVGADGIRSSIRRLVFGESPPRYRGQVSWRFITRRPPSIDDWRVFLGRGSAFLMIPISDTEMYCYADRTSAHSIEDPQAGRVERLQGLFHDFASPVRDVLAQSDAIEPIHFAPIEEVVHQPWASGCVALIGDAAHAMSPNMASGAALAFEDALVLAETVAAAGAVSEIAPEFMRRRLARVGWLQEQTERRDRTRHLPPAIRDIFIRLLAGRQYRLHYQPLLASI